MTTVADVRSACARVAAEASFVKINHERIAGYTAELLKKYPLITSISDDTHHLSAEYIMALDSINFGSGYFEIAKREGVALEYDVIAKGLKHAFLQGELNSPEKWLAVTPSFCHGVFSIPQGAHPALDELMQRFAHHLNVTGAMIDGFFDGHVTNLLEEAKGSAVRLAETVAQWPTFHDVADYKEDKVPILKRAQIFAADIYLALEGRGHAAFHDMDRLTIFADNMVPHVLRHDGILEYTHDLSMRIDGGIMIQAGSEEETELRAAAIHAVELMKQSTNGKVTSVNLDHIIWHRGYEPELYAKPSHKTLTAWY